TPNRVATSVLDAPAAHSSTIVDRNANACDDFLRRAHRVNCSRSSSVSTSSDFGRPVFATPHYHIGNELMVQDTRGESPYVFVGGPRFFSLLGAVGPLG